MVSSLFKVLQAQGSNLARRYLEMRGGLAQNVGCNTYNAQRAKRVMQVRIQDMICSKCFSLNSLISHVLCRGS